MSKAYKKGLFIFRRDLRLEDNSGLLAALEACEQVLPVFIFDPMQISPETNTYFSAPAFSFMLQSLTELKGELEKRATSLYVFTGEPESTVASLIQKDDIDMVFVNKDYTPFARKRDGAIAEVCEEAHIPFERFDDSTLAHLETIRTGDGNLYTVFTPFMKKAMTEEVAKPRKNNFSNYFSGAVATPTTVLTDYSASPAPQQFLLGGRSEGLALLKDTQYLKNYKDRRNIPADNGTSKLSAHHKFGTISIRESYQTAKEIAGAHSHFISELYWRDFYYYICYHFPQVFKKPFLPWAKHIAWVNDKKQFASWCSGQTGVPMVDAGMRELAATGWMHNRSRMIVASYLTKNLLIDWRWGEKYFAQKLVDYDPAQNNGGWQWSASTGADPRPLRIFNPFTQAQKFDSEAAYIRHWVPELSQVETKLLTGGKVIDFSKYADYLAPLVNQTESFHRTMEVYKTAKDTYRKEQQSS